jgi:hypothetical protein
MPTKKPKVQAVLTTQYHEKLLMIADIEGRSISQMTARIIEKYIDEYENENGKIDIKVGNIGQNNGIINM